MNRFNLIDTFFFDQADYIDFLVAKKQRIISNDEGTCFAQLTKDNGCFLYELIWLENGKFIGDYVKPFRATLENITQFNNGCKILADRLTLYLETNNLDLVPSSPPAFGDLTHLKE